MRLYQVVIALAVVILSSSHLVCQAVDYDGIIVNATRHLRHAQEMVQLSLTMNAASCTFGRSCNGSCYGNYVIGDYVNATNYGATPVNFDEMSHIMYGTNCTSANQVYDCAAQAMLSYAKTVINANFPWVYVTWNNGQLSACPAEDVRYTYGCPNYVNFNDKAWYAGASTTPATYVFIVDLNQVNYNDSIALFNKMINALTIGSTAGAVVYGTDVGVQSYYISAATYAHIDAIRTFVNGFSPQPLGSANNAYEMATDMLNSFEVSGKSPSKVIVWITNGQTDMVDTITVDEGILTITTLVNGVSRTIPNRLACATDGFVLDATTPSDTAALMFKTISSGVNMTGVIQYIEPYYDETSNQTVFTLSMPVYIGTGVAGVVSIDVVVASDDVDDLQAKLAAETAFSTIDILPSVIAGVSGTGMCNYSVDEAMTTRLFPLWVVLTLALSIGITIGTMVLFAKGKKVSYGCTFFIGSVMLVLCIIAMGLFFGINFNQIAMRETYIYGKGIVLAHSTNPHRCCRLIGCSCQETSAPSCSSVVANLNEGECSNGYYCCHRSCRCSRSLEERQLECTIANGDHCPNGGYENTTLLDHFGVARRYSSFRPSRGCTTTCYCSSWVYNRRCYSECGTCYTPTATIQYVNSYSGITIAHTSINCGFNDMDCVRNYLNGTVGSIGSQAVFWYDYRNPLALVYGFDLDIASLVFVGIFGLAIIVTLIIAAACYRNYSDVTFK